MKQNPHSEVEMLMNIEPLQLIVIIMMVIKKQGMLV